MRRLFARLLIFSLLLVPLLEISLRLFMPQQLITTTDLYTPDETGLAIRHRAGLDTSINTGERSVRFVTDENGYRVREQNEAPGDINILALGDSYLAAMQVEYDDTYIGLLEAGLSEELGKNVHIVNTGVAAYGPNSYAIMAHQELAKHDYDMVLVFVTTNDLETGYSDYFPPKTPDEHPLRMPQALTQREITNAILRPINNALEQESHLFVLLKNRGRALRAQIGITAEGFPQFLLRSQAERFRWDITADILTHIEAEADRRSIPVVYVIIPSAYQIDTSQLEWGIETFDIDRADVDPDQPTRHLEEEISAQGLTVYNLLPPLREAYEEQNSQMYGTIDAHLSPEGHRVVADFLEPILLRYFTGN